jgi:PTH1 family peptidyl-tRNA hydrolase
MKIIVGLGNPGREYEETRHNAGFRLLDRMAEAMNIEFKEARSLFSLVGKSGAAASLQGGQINDTVLLVKPTTYMNLSGQAVRAVLHWYKVDLQDKGKEKHALMVIHDDVSLNLGRIRFQAGRGAGGQHGVESIIEQLGGSKSFERLKIGVGPDPGGDVRGNYLLSKFRPDERELFEKVLDNSLGAVKEWFQKGTEHSANVYNGIDYSL